MFEEASTHIRALLGYRINDLQELRVFEFVKVVGITWIVLSQAICEEYEASIAAKRLSFKITPASGLGNSAGPVTGTLTGGKMIDG